MSPQKQRQVSPRQLLDPPGRTPDGHVIVHLSDEDWLKACIAGLRRVNENMDKLDSEDYARGKNDPEILASSLAVIAEVAVAQHLGHEFDWNMAVWNASDHARNRTRPDVGSNIEVRRVKYEDGAVNLRIDQVRKDLIVVAAYVIPQGHHHSVKILGWGNHDALWERGEWARFGSKVSNKKKYVDQKYLNRCTCFFDKSKHTCPPQPVNVAA